MNRSIARRRRDHQYPQVDAQPVFDFAQAGARQSTQRPRVQKIIQTLRVAILLVVLLMLLVAIKRGNRAGARCLLLVNEALECGGGLGLGDFPICCDPCLRPSLFPYVKRCSIARTSPLANLCPTVQFLDREPVQVRTRSPTPHKEPMLSGEAPFLKRKKRRKNKTKKNSTEKSSAFPCLLRAPRQIRERRFHAPFQSALRGALAVGVLRVLDIHIHGSEILLRGC